MWWIGNIEQGDSMILALDGILGLVVRNLSAFLDGIVYSILVAIYNLMFKIASINVFGGDNFANSMGNRVYAIIGIIMFFKLYLLNKRGVEYFIYSRSR